MPHILWAQSRPADAQRGVHSGLIHGLASTAYGQSLGIQSASEVAKRKDFVRRVPLVTYDDLKPWVMRARMGEPHVLWPGVTKWFAQSSGTTSDVHKWLPVTSESLQEGHYKGGKDVWAILPPCLRPNYNETPAWWVECLGARAKGNERT